MERLRRLMVGPLVLWTLFLAGAAHAQKTSPQVPVTYPGDTNETIARRAQWLEGAKKEGKVMWWTSTRPAEVTKVKVAFNKIYPFIEVDFWTSGGEAKAARMEAEYASRRYTADVLLGGDPQNFPRWREKGMLANFIDIIPNIRKLPQGMYSKHGDWAQPGNNIIAPQYNTKLVSTAEAPKSWEDLLSPKWKGQIGLSRRDLKFDTFALGNGGWGIERTLDFLTKLKNQNPIWSDGHVAGHSLLIAGEFKIFAAGFAYHVMQSQEKGAPVDWCRVNPVMVTGSAINMSKMAPHPNAAILFIEWLFSPQGLAIYEGITYHGAIYPGAETSIAKAIEGLNLNLVYRTEEVILADIKLGFTKKYYHVLGLTQN